MAFPFGAVIFDMDGLMVDTERVARRAWDRAFAEFGVRVEDQVYLQVIGRNAHDARGIWVAHFGADFPLDEAEARKTRYINEIYETEGVDHRPGLGELLAWVEAEGVPRAIATSTFAAQTARKLRIAGLADRFEVVVCGDQVARGKPEPDIFLEAARRLDVQPGVCIVLEDSEAGIRAAHAAGMTPLMVPDQKQPTDETRALAWRVCDSLHDVRALFAAL